MLTAFSALILGIVEGFAEFLPISSTAHLTLASHVLHLEQSEYVKTFEIAIQNGAILAILVSYWKKFLDLRILKRVILAFIPTGILGLVFYRFIKRYLVGNILVTLAALAIGGVFLIVFEKMRGGRAGSEDVSSMSYRKSVMIGLCQAIALVPGVSRSAATIVGGMMMGVKRKAIVEFSFFLAVPTMLAATGLDLAKNFGGFSSREAYLLAIGFLSSFLMALLSMRFLLSYIMRYRTLAGFGVYRIALVAIFALVYFL